MSAALFTGHMLTDPVLQDEIMRRCQAAMIPDEPASITHDLGLLRLPDGGAVRVWMIHAADAVLLDDLGQIVLITRLHDPGRGKQALPGGLLDATPHGPETSLTAALREATEETGISPALIKTAGITQLGHRRCQRPFDIRRAWNNLPGTPIAQGDLFTVSTLGFRLRLPGDLQDIAFTPGDDATAVEILPAREVTPDRLAVPDHLDLINEAMRL